MPSKPPWVNSILRPTAEEMCIDLVDDYCLMGLSNFVKVDLLLASSQSPQLAQGCGSWLDYYSLQSDVDQPITAACLVGDVVWLGDARGQIFAFR